jgi:hypothetical protein
MTRLEQCVLYAQRRGYQDFHRGFWHHDNPFHTERLRAIWLAAWSAENHKEVGRSAVRERETEEE